MASIHTFNQHLNIHHQPYYPLLQHEGYPSSEQEKLRLCKKIQDLIAKNNALKQTQQNLQGTVQDLRKILVVIGKQSLEETEYLHRRNEKLNEKVKRLSNGLKYTYKDGSHLQNCSQYWNQFLQ